MSTLTDAMAELMADAETKGWDQDHKALLFFTDGTDDLHYAATTFISMEQARRMPAILGRVLQRLRDGDCPDARPVAVGMLTEGWATQKAGPALADRKAAMAAYPYATVAEDPNRIQTRTLDVVDTEHHYQIFRPEGEAATSSVRPIADEEIQNQLLGVKVRGQEILRKTMATLVALT